MGSLELNFGLIESKYLNIGLMTAYRNGYSPSSIKFEDFKEAEVIVNTEHINLYFSTNINPIVFVDKSGLVTEYQYPTLDIDILHDTLNAHRYAIKTLNGIDTALDKYLYVLGYNSVPFRQYAFRRFIVINPKLDYETKRKALLSTRVCTEYNFEGLDNYLISIDKHFETRDDLEDIKLLKFFYNEKNSKVERNAQGKIKIYRGQTPKSTKYTKALSWTLDRQVAEMFAKRFNSKGRKLLLTGYVDIDDVLAFITDTEEAELLVRSKNIEQIESTYL